MAKPEFTRTVQVEDIGHRMKELSLTAEPAERAALARRFDLQALDALTAIVGLRREAGGVIVAEGRLDAEVVQTCVATLGPVPATVTDSFMVRFRPVDRLADGTEVEVDAEADDWEPLTGPTIDAGELVAQHLSLALDPYPRRSEAPPVGEEASVPGRSGEAEEGLQRPFTDLDRLLRKT